MTARRFLLLATAVFAVVKLGTSPATAAPLTVTVPTPAPPTTTDFKMGNTRHPDGITLTLDSQSLLLNSKRWLPVMGEFHYARYPEAEWREELLKMKAGGIDIVATYVFWIHHEEIEGQWDWSGRRDLRRFVELCGEVGLKVIVRCGPWCHGEVRNGGHPDWLRGKGWKLRSNDRRYLDKVRILYAQIFNQVSGLLWKDGGPVIGIQLENEYRGPAEHLLTLKQMAREAGLDVPLYTRTGWPTLSSPMPFGEIIPLYGAYAEGFWDRELTAMPGRYWAGFHFSLLRTDANIANEILGRTGTKDTTDVARYPYLTCEIGGGMMSSYHRRIRIHPADVESTTLVKLGSGSTSPGYYMYHGGVNPEGRRSTLMESQATGGWNDLPVKNYDFQTALGQYGQVRPQYHWFRRQHLFLRDYGAALAGMPSTMPDQRPAGRDDTETLRWCVRSDGHAGFVFVNNHERLRDLPPKEGVQFTIKRPPGTTTFPETPITIPSESRFFWPYNLDLGHGVTLAWATAQPVCAVDEGAVRTVFFTETPGVTAEFAFPDSVTGPIRRRVSNHWRELKPSEAEKEKGILVCSNVTPAHDAALEVNHASAESVRIVLLNESDSLALWKASWQGAERVFLTRAGLVPDGDRLRLSSTQRDELSVGIYPAPEVLKLGRKRVPGKSDGVFRRFSPRKPREVSLQATVEGIQEAGPARTIPLGKAGRPVAAAPTDADFEQAAVWRVRLPEELNLKIDPLLRLAYIGDVARLTLNGRLVTDDFYNGDTWEIGLRRHAPDILNGDLRVAILPLRRDAPIYLPPKARPEFSEGESMAALRKVELVPRYTLELTAP